MSTKWSHPPCLTRSLDWSGRLVQCQTRNGRTYQLLLQFGLFNFLNPSLQKLQCASGTHFGTHFPDFRAISPAAPESETHTQDRTVPGFMTLVAESKHIKLDGSHMGVSKNRGTPKWMVYNGKPY